MHQGGGLERVVGRFVRHVPGRQLAQLVVDERQQLRRGVWVAGVDGGQDARDIRHEGSLAELYFAVTSFSVTCARLQLLRPLTNDPDEANKW